jgi:hypothetical protein
MKPRKGSLTWRKLHEWLRRNDPNFGDLKKRGLSYSKKQNVKLCV